MIICELAVTCSLLFGGATYHFTEKYAPERGYSWNNQTIGFSMEQNKKGFYNGINLATFKDSFNKRSFTFTSTYGFRINDNIAFGMGTGYTKTSYYEGVLLAPYGEICHLRICGTILGLPNLVHNDAFINLGLKVRF